MVNKELVRRKLNKLIQYLNEISGITDYTFQDYLDNYFIKRTTERLLQLIVEVATDINGHIAIDAGNPPPKNYFQSFIILAQLEVIDRELAKKIAPSAGMRNRLVHEYEEIDDKIVYENIPEAIEMYNKYITQVEAYLKDK